MKKPPLFLLFLLFFMARLFSAEFQNGRVRLVLNEETGRFSLYYLADLDSGIFEPLFSDRDPRTSVLSLMLNDRVYRLGESSAFRTRIGGTTDEPEIIFESPGITVTERFTFIAAGNSAWANGVSVAVYVVNRGERPVEAGLRFLLDTSLGEENGTASPVFNTDLRLFSSETLLNENSPDAWWISRNSRYGLQGTLDSVYVLPASSVHFANWKRMNDANWTLQFSPRNFSNPPHSFNDAAVAYYFEKETVAPKSFRVVEMLFSAETADGFAQVNFAVPPAYLARNSGAENMPGREESIRRDLIILRSMMNELDAFYVRGEAAPEEKLAEMELVVARVRERYGIF